MRKQILFTVGYSFVFFLGVAVFRHEMGVTNYIKEAIIMTIPSAISFFLAYWVARKF